MASSSKSLRVGIFTPIDLIEKMNQMEDEVKNVLDEPRSVLHLLLHNFNWEKETFLKAISKDKNGTLELVKNSELEGYNCSPIRVAGSCQICYSTITERAVIKGGPLCGHPFCKDCWFQYLSIQISVNEKCIGLECPMTNCKSLVEDPMIANICMKVPHIVSSYRKLLSTSFISRSVKLR